MIRKAALGLTAVYTVLSLKTSCIYPYTLGVLNDFVKPTVLHLSTALVVTNYTINGNLITLNRLIGKRAVTSLAVCAVSTVNEKLITISVYNVKVTILCVGNGRNDTGNVVLVGCISIGSKSLAKENCLRNSKNCIRLRNNNCGASVALEVAVVICMTGSLSLRIGVGVIAECTGVGGVTTCCTGRSGHNVIIVVSVYGVRNAGLGIEGNGNDAVISLNGNHVVVAVVAPLGIPSEVLNNLNAVGTSLNVGVNDLVLAVSIESKKIAISFKLPTFAAKAGITRY